MYAILILFIRLHSYTLQVFLFIRCSYNFEEASSRSSSRITDRLISLSANDETLYNFCSALAKTRSVLGEDTRE